jgi:hypothetical protein
LFHFLFETAWVDLEVALDFAVVTCNRQIVVSSNSSMLSLSPSLVLCSCLLLTSFQALSFITRIVEKEQNVQWCSDIHQYKQQQENQDLFIVCMWMSVAV